MCDYPLDTMIFKSWNCTGLGPKLNTASFTQWVKDADVVTLQETFLDTLALQVAGFVPVIHRATPAPAGMKHQATGGLVTLISSQLASVFRFSCVELFQCDGFEGQCILFERCDDSREDLPAQFLLLNCYIVAHPAAFDYNAFYFALEAFLLAYELPTIIAGDFNAHWKTSGARLPTPVIVNFGSL
jgi:exonuclease III